MIDPQYCISYMNIQYVYECDTLRGFPPPPHKIKRWGVGNLRHWQIRCPEVCLWGREDFDCVELSVDKVRDVSWSVDCTDSVHKSVKIGQRGVVLWEERGEGGRERLVMYQSSHKVHVI